MTLTLKVDASVWREHQRDLKERVPGLVPVIKGNGYGFRNTTLAAEAQGLGTTVIAVGIAREALRILDAGWHGDIVVLNPWRPGDPVARDLLRHSQVITMVSRVEDLERIDDIFPAARVQLEVRTSMRRHGMSLEALHNVDTRNLRFEGWSIHLPATGSLAEARHLAHAATSALDGDVWVSHLSIEDYNTLHGELAGRARMRVGTRLWLGAADAVETTATVLDTHPIKRGERLGYHQAKAPSDGWIVVTSGGTAHGIALSAPVPQRSVKQRAVTVAQGLLDAAGRSLSPFKIAGKKRPFAEPPHMHSSMLFVAGDDPGARVGEEIPVTCRMTTTTFDQIIWA